MFSRLPLTTRSFFFTAAPVCLVLIASFSVFNAAVRQRVRQDIREALQSSDRMLKIADDEFSRQNSALLAKLTDSAGVRASVGLLAEASGDPAEMKQVHATIEAQLAELRDASLYDLMAVSDPKGRTVALVSTQSTENSMSTPLLPVQEGLADLGGTLYQLQSVPIEIGGEPAATLTMGRHFSLERASTAESAVLMKDGHIVLSSFAPSLTGLIASQIKIGCGSLKSGCEISLNGESYLVSALQRSFLREGFELLEFRSLDQPMRAFQRAFFRILFQVGAVCLLLALISTAITSRSVSQPLSRLAKQLEKGADSGVFPERLEARNGVREIDLVATAFNRLTRSERQSRSQLEIAKQTAESGNRLKTEFLTNVSHELLTPMNGVIGMTELLLATPLDTEQRDFAATVFDSARAMQSLVENILNFSDLESGKSRLQTKQFSLWSVFEDVLMNTKRAATKKPIQVEGSMPASIPDVCVGDEERIRHVLTHLTDNAVKFTESGNIRLSAECVRTSSADVEVTFHVKDSGIGISPLQRELIFEPFVQADGSLTRRHGGTGIGLCLAKAAVELMGGRIGVESEPGAGSDFWFTLSLGLPSPVAVGWAS